MTKVYELEQKLKAMGVNKISWANFADNVFGKQNATVEQYCDTMARAATDDNCTAEDIAEQILNSFNALESGDFEEYVDLIDPCWDYEQPKSDYLDKVLSLTPEERKEHFLGNFDVSAIDTLQSVVDQKQKTEGLVAMHMTRGSMYGTPEVLAQGVLDMLNAPIVDDNEIF